MEITVESVCATRALLGEGALWDPARGIVWWVDIRASTVHAHDAATGHNRSQRLPFRITALALADDDSLLGCGDEGFVRFAVGEGLRLEVAGCIAQPDEPQGNRFNDGAVDHRGRFWAGTMDDAEGEPRGSLYRLDARGAARVLAGIAVPNGPCFPGLDRMLATDTAAGVIREYRLDEDGTPVFLRDFARFEASQGYPDGMAVDAEGGIWIAFWDGACLRRLDAEGRVTREIPLPVRRPTRPVFGGPRLDRLYVTSAATGLDEATLAAEPWSGHLLRLDAGVRGLPPHRYAAGDAPAPRGRAPHSAQNST